MTEQNLAVGPSVDANTDVVLFDGATLNIAVRVYFKAATQPEMVVRTAVSDWFHSDGDAQQLTVSKFVNDINHSMKLIAKLKGLNDATNASIVGFSIKSAPLPGFEDKSKQVTAILQSGETVRLTFGAPPGMAPAPGGYEMSQAYALLSASSWGDLGSGFQKKLNDRLLPPNNGWGYLILSMERIGCCCECRPGN